MLPPLAYKPGWQFKVGGPGGRFLCVFATTPDSLNPERERCTQHMWEIPDLGREDLARWVFARLLDAERHEASEFFQFDGLRPFWPNHAEGDPYEHVERWAHKDATMTHSDRDGQATLLHRTPS